MHTHEAGQQQSARLRAEITRLQAQCEAQRAALEALFASQKRYAGRKHRQAAAKYAFIREHAGQWRIDDMCRALGVSRISYSRYLQRQSSPTSGGRMRDEALLEHIRTVHAASQGRYGWPRTHRELREQGVRVGKERVRRLMQEHGIQGRGGV